MHGISNSEGLKKLNFFLKGPTIFKFWEVKLLLLLIKFAMFDIQLLLKMITVCFNFEL